MRGAEDVSAGGPAPRNQAAGESLDLGGRLVVGLRGLEPDQVRGALALLDPFRGGAAAARADVTLVGHDTVPTSSIVELQGPANDGTTTGRHADGRLLVRFGGRWASLPGPDDTEFEIALEPGLSPSACWADLVRPCLQQALHAGGAVAVHAAAVDDGGSGTLVTGWSESGKTEVALALVEAGAGFLSDKWTVAGSDGEVSAFPVGVGIRGWVLEALPRLRGALPPRARVQLRVARAASGLLRPAVPNGAGGLAWRALQRAVELGDRAGLSPTEVLTAYGELQDPARRLPLGTVLVLVTGASPRVVVEEANADWAARRLAHSGAYERRRWFDLQERAAYAELEHRSGARDATVEREHQLMARAFVGARVLRVECPFPGDPRRVVDALAAAR